MSTYLKDSGTQDILNYLQKKETASIEELAAAVFVSPSSVRRKLTVLQENGLVIRTHGGARLNKSETLSSSFSFRSHQNSFEKKKIALMSTEYIKDGDFIFLDGSTTAFYLAELLSEFKNIKVMTNGIDTVSTLSKYNIEAYSTGGKVSAANRSVLVGQNAIQTVQHYHADVFLFSAQSIDKDGNIYDCFEEENFVRMAMMKNAGKKIFLCDSSKLNRSSVFKLCGMGDVDQIVSDTDISEYFQNNMEQAVAGKVGPQNVG